MTTEIKTEGIQTTIQIMDMTTETIIKIITRAITETIARKSLAKKNLKFSIDL